jgi:hypothetical protein
MKKNCLSIAILCFLLLNLNAGRFDSFFDFCKGFGRKIANNKRWTPVVLLGGVLISGSIQLQIKENEKDNKALSILYGTLKMLNPMRSFETLYFLDKKTKERIEKIKLR